MGEVTGKDCGGGPYNGHGGVVTSSTPCRVKLRDIACQNKRVVYDLLIRAAAETTLAIAADPRHLGARIGITAVLHTWGSALTHHPLMGCSP